ncbi:hypothetical protein CRENBAI_018653 [Crenichthys baileyi]|uniref:Uncharacterized protein n=1 Tax=Crenichthys baileyi TaxID=28760 RepID=A0AAV9S0G9_9TELE
MCFPSSCLCFGPTQNHIVTEGTHQTDQADRAKELKRWIKQQDETLCALYGEEVGICFLPLLLEEIEECFRETDWAAMTFEPGRNRSSLAHASSKHSTPAAAALGELVTPTAASPQLTLAEPPAEPSHLRQPQQGFRLGFPPAQDNVVAGGQPPPGRFGASYASTEGPPATASSRLFSPVRVQSGLEIPQEELMRLQVRGFAQYLKIFPKELDFVHLILEAEFLGRGWLDAPAPRSAGGPFAPLLEAVNAVARSSGSSEPQPAARSSGSSEPQSAPAGSSEPHLVPEEPVGGLPPLPCHVPEGPVGGPLPLLRHVPEGPVGGPLPLLRHVPEGPVGEPLLLLRHVPEGPVGGPLPLLRHVPEGPEGGPPPLPRHVPEGPEGGQPPLPRHVPEGPEGGPPPLPRHVPEGPEGGPPPLPRHVPEGPEGGPPPFPRHVPEGPEGGLPPRPGPVHLLGFLWGVLTELMPDFTPQPDTDHETSQPDTVPGGSSTLLANLQISCLGPSLCGPCLGPSRMPGPSLRHGSRHTKDLQGPRFVDSSGLVAGLLDACISVAAGLLDAC